MSAGREQNDSDGSWTWVDNEEDNFRKRAEQRRASSYERAEVEDVPLTDESALESDVSVLTDPEDHPAAGEAVAEGTPLGSNELEAAKAHFKEMAAAMHKAAAVKAALDVARPGESELAVTERRARAYLRSTLTSAGFMIGGLLIAAYCQWGCDSSYTSPVQEYYEHPYEGRDVEFIQEDFRGGKYRKPGKDRKDQLKYTAHAHKNAREKYEDERPGQHGKRPRDDFQDLQDLQKDKKQKKGDSKHKKEHNKEFNTQETKNKDVKKGKQRKGHDDSYTDKENQPKEKKHKKNNEKHGKHEEHKEHEDYLYKKEAYLKQKEGKLKQKEFKLYAKDASNEKHAKKHRKPKLSKHNETSSGEWYDNMHKGRKDKRRQDEQADWMFERAQGRDKKRDKAHWYFDMMDERETNREKKH